MIIYEGRTRFDKVFKKIELSWDEIKEKLSKTVRTNETVSEYKAMPKARQDGIKDVGAFVAGTLDRGRRTAIKSRCIVTLDADYADGSFQELVSKALKDTAYLYYSTHKHTPENPRYRLLIPLTRSVTPEEYGAASRRLADMIGIDMFDDTTYQHQRIMYYPSTSRNGEYVFEVYDGDFVDPDEILKTYSDWKDVRLWPVSSRQVDHIRLSSDKVENPLEKSGPVGAFCKAYSIEEAIEKFVPDYKPGRFDGRYTYAKGTTSNGVVVYDGLYTFSHHESDPASLRLCNAFDLVRLHKFGHLDRKDNYESDLKAPSYRAMLDFALKDEKVIKELVAEIADDFEDGSESPPPSSDDEPWAGELELNRAGYPVSNYHNTELILRNHKRFKGNLSYNEFTEQVCYKGEPITDHIDASIRSFLDRKFSITGKDRIYDCVNIICRENKFHPVKDYLEGLTWDGVPRLEEVFINYFGATDEYYEEYTRAVSQKFFYAAVKRIYEPGCHFDEMLTLRSEQGSGKSSFFRRISKGFFTDSIKDIKSKDAMDGLRGVWICEFGELSAFRKAESETIKAFVSSPVDRFRAAYGRRTEEHKRSCVFVGTTNELEFLRDRTGNRRYWIVNSSKGVKPSKDVFKLTEAEIDQLWAEAKFLYDNGLETTVLTGEAKRLSLEMQESFRTEDPKEAEIEAFLEEFIPDGYYEMTIDERIDLRQFGKIKGSKKRDRVCAAQVWQECFGNRATRALGRYETMEINAIIDRLPDWTRETTVRIEGYGRVRGFVHAKRYKRKGQKAKRNISTNP